MSSHVFDIDCPSCGIRCWVNDGDISDVTAPDVEAVRCWNCHSEFHVDPESDEPLEMLFVEDTYQTASQAVGE